MALHHSFQCLHVRNADLVVEDWSKTYDTTPPNNLSQSCLRCFSTPQCQAISQSWDFTCSTNAQYMGSYDLKRPAQSEMKSMPSSFRHDSRAVTASCNSVVVLQDVWSRMSERKSKKPLRSTGRSAVLESACSAKQHPNNYSELFARSAVKARVCGFRKQRQSAII